MKINVDVKMQNGGQLFAHFKPARKDENINHV